MIEQQTKLNAGNFIRVEGYVMFAKLTPGRYRIKRISEYYGKKVYDITRSRSNRVIVRHLANEIDYFLSDKNNKDINKIYKD